MLVSDGVCAMGIIQNDVVLMAQKTKAVQQGHSEQRWRKAKKLSKTRELLEFHNLFWMDEALRGDE